MAKLSKALNKKYDKIKYLYETGQTVKGDNNRLLHRFLQNRLAVFGLIVFSIITLACIIGPFFAVDPTLIDLSNINKAPTAEHLLGTDSIGRDVFSRLLSGGRMSIFIGLSSSIVSCVIGVAFGCVGGYKGGLIDATALRICEILTSFPKIILTLLLVSIMGQSVSNILLVFMFTSWCPIYRITRSQVMSVKQEEYIQALQGYGINQFVIMFKHILPNTLSPIIVNLTLGTAGFILSEAGLSFLGLGVPLEQATWGNILNSAQNIDILQNSWWLWLPAGLLISLFVLSINFIGDGLRDSADLKIVD